MQSIKNLLKQQLLLKKIENIFEKTFNVIQNIYQKYLEEFNKKYNNKIIILIIYK